MPWFQTQHFILIKLDIMVLIIRLHFLGIKFSNMIFLNSDNKNSTEIVFNNRGWDCVSFWFIIIFKWWMSIQSFIWFILFKINMKNINAKPVQDEKRIHIFQCFIQGVRYSTYNCLYNLRHVFVIAHTPLSTNKTWLQLNRCRIDKNHI